jgi:hypothetical protein
VLAQLGFRLENYTVAGLPAAGNAGRLAWATDSQRLQVDTGGAWSALSAVGDSPFTLANLSLAITANSPGANEMTIALKTRAGTDPSAIDPIDIAFRSATVTTANYVTRTITSALSATIPVGATLGFAGSGQVGEVFVYLVDTGSGVVLAVTAKHFANDDHAPHFLHTLDTAADFWDRIYSATAILATKPIRYIGNFTVTIGTAGNWGTAPSAASLALPQKYRPVRNQVVLSGANGFGSTGTMIRRFSTYVVADNLGYAIQYNASATDGDSVSLLEDGIYTVSYSDAHTAVASFGISKNSAQTATSVRSISTTSKILVTEVDNTLGSVSATQFFPAGTALRAHTSGGLTGGAFSGDCKLIVSKVAD